MALWLCLSAVEPNGLVGIDDKIFDEEIGLVIWIKLIEASIKASVESTWSVEIGLGDGVVSGKEVETYDITHVSVYLIGRINVFSLSTNGYVVDFAVSFASASAGAVRWGGCRHDGRRGRCIRGCVGYSNGFCRSLAINDDDCDINNVDIDYDVVFVSSNCAVLRIPSTGWVDIDC